MIGAILEDDKAGKFSGWFPQVTDDPEVWERRRKLLTPNTWPERSLQNNAHGIVPHLSSFKGGSLENARSQLAKFYFSTN
eukprot:12985445-Ditylum_brightwellii.AAC.1